jgi:hypothetical protein
VEHGGATDFFKSDLVLLPDRKQGFVLLMNQDHQFDAYFAAIELRMGILDLMLGAPPHMNGVSMRTLGYATLGGFLLTCALVTRSLLRLRGWSRRARALSTARLIGAIAPHFIIPIVVLVAVYQIGARYLHRSIGLEYGPAMMPDLTLWIAVGTIPDALIGIYKVLSTISIRLAKPPRRLSHTMGQSVN